MSAATYVTYFMLLSSIGIIAAALAGLRVDLLAPALALGLGLTGLTATAAHANCSPGFITDVLCQVRIINQQTANGPNQVQGRVRRPHWILGPAERGGGGKPRYSAVQ